VLLESATLSISINGAQHGYFNCNRGVRQGEPLSPLLFCIAEDVLSISISLLVEQGKISLINSSRYHNIPSHIMYADDIMIFCKGKISSVEALIDLFRRYAKCSGQCINPAKSTIFSGSISRGRLEHLVNMLGFNSGNLPFNYLGVPIFKGKPKASHLQPIADKIKTKLNSWQASFLSIAGRALLIKSVIHPMLTHSMAVYSWPKALLKDIDKWSRNFIWSGNTEIRKMVTVSWHKPCKPLEEGGLGIRSLVKLNEANNLKLSWEMLNSKQPWAISLKDKVIKKRSPITYHVSSSIWSSIKSEYPIILENSSWLLGNGENINFWSDNWCGVNIAECLNLHANVSVNLSATVKDFIVDNSWHIPTTLQQTFPQL